MISIEKNKIIIEADGQAAPGDPAGKAALDELRVAIGELCGLKKYRSACTRLDEAKQHLKSLQEKRGALIKRIEQLASEGGDDRDEQRELTQSSQGLDGASARVRGIEQTIVTLREAAFTESQSYIVANSARLYASAKKNLQAAVSELTQQAEALTPGIQAVDSLKSHFNRVGVLTTKAGAAEFLKHLIALPI